MATARQRLDEINSRVKKGGRSGNDTSLPADYSSIIKAAQAEDAAARNASGSSAAVPKPSVRPRQSASVEQPTRGKPPIPESADDARSAAAQPRVAPTPTPRPDAADGGDSEGGSDLLGILAGVLGAGAAYALYKRLAKGDPAAIEEAKSVMNEGAKAQAGGEVSVPANRSVSDPDPSRFGSDVVDAEFEELPEQRQLPSPDPRAQMDDYLSLLDQQTGMVEAPEAAAIEAPPQQKMIAGPEGDEDIDAIIRSAIEGGKSPRVQSPNPNIKPRPRVKPKV